MADLAIGISKTVVEALVKKVNSAIKEEEEKWQTLERDIVFIKDEFEMMQSFLDIATANGEHMKNQVARTWVRQVRDLSYDTEDCIESVLDLDTKRTSCRKPLLWLNMNCFICGMKGVQRMLPLDKAVADIKQLMARAGDVNQRNMRYSIISNPGEQIGQTTAASRRTLDIKNSTDAFNNQEDILDLATLINTEDKDLQVISIFGTGGKFGTSSIIKKAYDDPDICKMFQCRAWVKLVHPFNPHEFIRSLLAGFYTNSPSRQEKEAEKKSVHTDENSNTRWSLGKGISSSLALAKFAKSLVRIHQNLQNTSGEQEADIGVKVLETMKATQDSILTDFMETIKNKTYLIVLEDLSSIVEWNIIRTFMPDMNNKSRIVVSTQQHEIASLCMEQPNHEGLLRMFSPDHSVYAVFKKLPKRLPGSEHKKCTKDEIRAIQRDKSSANDHWQTKHELFGREYELNKLEGQIEIAYQRRAGTVISVWGMAGVGKSFLVKAIYNHFAEMFESCALVSATHPFDINNFCQDLVDDLKQLEGPDASSLEEKDGKNFVRCREHMEKRSCLVVIDGLRSSEDWDLIEGNLISGASRSCIIVITREESVATYCAKSDNAVWSIHGLEAVAAGLLFDKKVKELEPEKHDGNGDSRWDSSTKEEARLIIDKCGRLPKLTVALVDYLAKVPDPRREAQRLNGNFMNALRTGSQGLDGFRSFREVFTGMYSSFLACPQLLKKCIFYLSIFTQSNVIRRSRLLRRWIAEGYSEGTDSRSMVEYTKNLIQKLVNLGMMVEQRTKTPTMVGAADMRSCEINSLFLQYVISRQMEENIFPPLEISVLKGDGFQNPQRVGQHLVIGSSWKRDKFVLDNLDLSRLRSLTVSREWGSFLISDRMTVLRVLDLEDTNVNDEDIEPIMKLRRLKFLSLRGCIKVSCLPESLGSLTLLQTLDIRNTSVTKLPKSITKLQKLQYIRAAAMVALMDEQPTTLRSNHGHGHHDACDGITVPGGIGELMSLHTLGVVNISATGARTILKELKNLTQLNNLGVSGINQSNMKGFFSAIEYHSSLQSLALQVYKGNDLEWLGKMSLPGNLRRIRMYVHVVKYPNWSCLQVLGQIRRLQSLSLRFETGRDVALQFCDSRDTPGQFGELKVLEIACSSNLHVKFTTREMALLKILKVHCLNGSTLHFSGIEHLTSLKHVWIKGSFDDIVKEELQRKVGQHPMKPVWILD